MSALWALDARVALTLTGPGGGTWWIDEAGGGLAPSNGAVAAHVTAPALTFPQALPAVLEHRRTTTDTNARASLERQECSPMPGTVTDAVLAVR
ncbi:hypothetical protein [Streptomyces sp. LN590]|uniref:hypothetical protein n=1 Tax=unclassified Streptomyces TaxID=2593676 RepID=UPI003718B9C2